MTNTTTSNQTFVLNTVVYYSFEAYVAAVGLKWTMAERSKTMTSTIAAPYGENAMTDSTYTLDPYNVMGTLKQLDVPWEHVVIIATNQYILSGAIDSETADAIIAAPCIESLEELLGDLIMNKIVSQETADALVKSIVDLAITKEDEAMEDAMELVDGKSPVMIAIEEVLISCVDSGTFDETAAMHINTTWEFDTLGSMLISCVDSGTCTEEAAQAVIAAFEDSSPIALPL